MKYFFTCFILFAMFAVTADAQQPKTGKTQPKPKVTTPTKSTALKTDEDKMSYLSGYDFGLKVTSNIKANNFPLRNASFLAGIKDALEGIENQLPPEEIQRIVEIFQKMNPQNENQQKLDEIIQKSKKEGDEFLAANAKKDSVMTTASGLQYKILRVGSGKSPADTSTVTVHYRGRLINGVVFDESYARGEPATFRLNQVIRGWTEGLQLMKEGGKMELFIPSGLAYGDRPAGQLIPPGSTLIFEVELIAVQ